MTFSHQAVSVIKKSKGFVRKWVKCFEETKTVDGQLEQGVWCTLSRNLDFRKILRSLKMGILPLLGFIAGFSNLFSSSTT